MEVVAVDKLGVCGGGSGRQVRGGVVVVEVDMLGDAWW